MWDPMWVKIRVLFQLARIKGERQIHSFKKIEVRARKLNFFPLPAFTCTILHIKIYFYYRSAQLWDM